MSLFHYLKPINRLPTAEQAGLPATIVQEVNQAVQDALDCDTRTGKKRKYTVTFTPGDRAAIGQYAAENSNAAAVKKFKDTHDVGESTVRSFKKKYLGEVKKWQVSGTTFKDVKRLPGRKRGRKVMLGEQLDGRIQNYVKALRSAGTPIGSSVKSSLVKSTALKLE